MENSEKTPVLDLGLLNIPLKQFSENLNGIISVNRNEKGRFEASNSPQTIRELVLRTLIYLKYPNLESFAARIGKTKGWVSFLIKNPERIKVKPETEQRVSEALGLNIKL